jgi:hypothetical protein
MKDLCIKKYKNYKIYLHNFSKFDGIFLLKALTNVENASVEPIIHDGKLINISFSSHHNNISIYFRDSYLLLLSSLSKLGNSFNLKNDHKKSIFPILFNDINYIGSVPEFKIFTNINLKDYEEYKNKFINSPSGD